MVRKLAYKLLSLLLILPSVSFALGLGDIRLHSALNQPLNADIELLSVPETDVDSIQVALASHETFARVGVERPAVLMFLKFDVVQRGGRYYIHVHSKEAIKEPFLDFLVEVSWRSGRLLREYTMLIDPPGMAPQGAPALEAPMMASVPATTGDMNAAPVPVSTAERAVAPVSAPSRGGLRYGPVKANDTLWAIARDMRPNKSVSVQQMMVALLKANPEAFYDNNVNRLKKGYVLRVDDPAVINAISQAEAVRAISAQNRAWQDYVNQVAAAAAERPSTETTPQAARAVAAPEEPRLKLVAPEGVATEGAGTSAKVEGASAENLRQELMLAQETSEAQQRENAELRKRVQELEGQITSMQRLLTLKDSDLASLQQQMGNVPEQAKAAPSQPEAKDETKPEATTEVASAAATPAAEAEKPAAELVAAATEQPAAVQADKPAAAAPAAEAGDEKAAAEKEQPATAAPAQAEKAKKPVRRPVAPPPAPVETSLLDDLMADPLMMAGAGGVLIALLVLLLVVKRRRASGAGFSESILTAGGTSSMLSSKTTAGAPSSEESSLFSDLAVSGMNSLQGADSEVDPLTEADVYMAYGRYQQAEDLLKDALKNHEERHDLKVKLLEVYYATKDRPAFEGLANEVFTALEGNGPLWGKVLVMGHELCPDNPMFSAAPEAGMGLPGVGGQAAGNDVLDIGIDLDALTEDMESSPEAGGTPFNLDLGVDFSDLAEGKAAAPAAEPMDLNFDLPQETAAAPAEEEPVGAIDLSDLDFGAAEPATSTTATSKGSEMEFDLGDLSFGEDTPAAKGTAAGGKGAASLDFDLGDLNLDLGEGAGTDAGSGLGDLDLGDMDAVGTKLDLAKAYVDMGEPDSARSILDEVMQEGNAEQKRQAQELLGQLA